MYFSVERVPAVTVLPEPTVIREDTIIVRHDPIPGKALDPIIGYPVLIHYLSGDREPGEFLESFFVMFVETGIGSVASLRMNQCAPDSRMMPIGLRHGSADIIGEFPCPREKAAQVRTLIEISFTVDPEILFSEPPAVLVQCSHPWPGVDVVQNPHACCEVSIELLKNLGNLVGIHRLGRLTRIPDFLVVDDVGIQNMRETNLLQTLDIRVRPCPHNNGHRIGPGPRRNHHGRALFRRILSAVRASRNGYPQGIAVRTDRCVNGNIHRGEFAHGDNRKGNGVLNATQGYTHVRVRELPAGVVLQADPAPGKRFHASEDGPSRQNAHLNCRWGEAHDSLADTHLVNVPGKPDMAAAVPRTD